VTKHHTNDGDQERDGDQDESEQLLGRILAALEKRHSRGWVEVACAVVLALSTMSSAWCAYQSKLWSGVQGSRGGAASEAVRKAVEDRVLAGEIRAIEAAVFVRFVEAKMEGKDQLADFLASRLLPETREALVAWWAMKPLTNHEAPRSPFLLPQYKQAQTEEAKQQEQLAAELNAEGRAARRNSDTYVLLTVLFASVLFFGGIAGTFASDRLRRTVLGIALALFLVTFSVLVTMPVAWR
jgi:hypothetical protein